MGRLLAACGAMVVVILTLLAYWFSGDLNPLDRQLVAKHGTGPFTPSAWMQADPAGRGALLADLFDRHEFEEMYGEGVETLLGDMKDCYVNYDDEPCYAVVLGEARYDLQFSLNHSNDPGRVVGVRLVER